jgi:hypothetical protein
MSKVLLVYKAHFEKINKKTLPLSSLSHFHPFFTPIMNLNCTLAALAALWHIAFLQAQPNLSIPAAYFIGALVYWDTVAQCRRGGYFTVTARTA